MTDKEKRVIGCNLNKQTSLDKIIKIELKNQNKKSSKQLFSFEGSFYIYESTNDTF